jgi:hypothetical protein
MGYICTWLCHIFSQRRSYILAINWKYNTFAGQLHERVIIRLITRQIELVIDWLSEWLLFNANLAIYQLYHGENKLIFNVMVMKSPCTRSTRLVGFCILLAHWNNSPWDKHVIPLGHIILIPSQQVFALSS